MEEGGKYNNEELVSKLSKLINEDRVKFINQYILKNINEDMVNFVDISATLQIHNIRNYFN